MRAMVFCIVVCAVAVSSYAADLSAVVRDGSAIVTWTGDETIALVAPAEGGLLQKPVTLRVGKQVLSFGGFLASMNRMPAAGWKVVAERCTAADGHVLIEQTLQHPALRTETKAMFDLWMTPESKVIRCKVSLSGVGQHLDDLRLGDFSPGFTCRRMFFGMSVIDGPVGAFDFRAVDDKDQARGMNRFWVLELANGVTLLQATDAVPTRFQFSPGDEHATASISTYCNPSIVYSFVVTEQGAQAALTEYAKSIEQPASPALAKLPGRCTVVATYPIKDHLEAWYREFTARGARDLLWLSFADRPDDADQTLLEGSNSLLVPYTNYIDYFDPRANLIEGQVPSPDWKRENCMFDAGGRLTRGYKRSTRLLPDLYTKWALGGELQRGFYNLSDYQNVCRAKGFYFDVHAAVYPRHYYDAQGQHHSQAEYLKHTADLFALARKMSDDGPVSAEWGGEWLAGAMDSGAFIRLQEPDRFGIKGAGAEWYPNLDQVHRRHHLPISIADHGNWAEKEWDNPASAFQRRVAQNVLFGRSEMIHCYWNADLRRMDSRLMAYYLNSAYHRTLGVGGIEKIEFADGNIHRPIVAYEGGTKAWINLGDGEWLVDGYRLGSYGYLIKGPRFLQYCVRSDAGPGVVEFVRSDDYWLMASGSQCKFPTGELTGAVAVRRLAPGKLRVYEIQKPLTQDAKTKDVSMVQLSLPELLGRPGPYRLRAAKNVFVDRVADRLEGTEVPVPAGVKRPARWPSYQVVPTQITGDVLTFAPSQDPGCCGYEFEFDEP